MPKRGRKNLIQIIERVALGMVLVDVALYVAAFRPLDRLIAAEQQRHKVARLRFHEGLRRLTRLEQARAALPTADEQVKVFLRDHVPQRRRGFSRAARLVRQLTEESGVQLSSVAYRLDSTRDEPLQRMGIEVSVEGPFRGLLDFTHGLETASDLVVIRSFTFEPTEGGTVALRLGADLYLEP